MQNVPNIVRQRLKAETSATDHPDANVLSAFAEQALSDGERSAVLDHLARCIECRDVLALALPATEIIQPAVKPSPTRWLTWPALRWGLVAAGVAVIATFGVMQYQRNARPQAQFARVASQTQDSQTQDLKLAEKVPPAPLNSDAPAKKAEPSFAKAESPASLDKNPQPSPALKAEQKIEHRALVAVPSSPQPNPKVAPGLLTQSAPVAPLAPRPSEQNLAQNSALNLSKKVPAASESVEVQGASPSVPDSQVEGDSIAAVSSDESTAKVGKAKDATPSNTAAPAVSGRNFTQLIAVGSDVAPRWNITATGSLQRSYDQGASWQDVDVIAASSTGAVIGGPMKAPVANANALGTSLGKQSLRPVFRAVAANGADVWAGGTAGLLYHSIDAGNHWSRVLPSGAGFVLAGDIVSIEFPDAQHGTITTSTPEVWTTPDNGGTWQKQ